MVDDSIFPVTYAIDYVRVYQKGAAATPARFASRKALKEKKPEMKPKSVSAAGPESKRNLRR